MRKIGFSPKGDEKDDLDVFLASDGEAVSRAGRLSNAASGKALSMRKRMHDDEGRYSAVKEAKVAVGDLKNEMGDKNASVGHKVAAIFKFILHILHMFVRTVWRFLVAIAVIAIVCFVVGAIGVGYLYFASAKELPNIDDYTKVSMPQDSTIYDIDGGVIGVVSTVSRDVVGFGEISQPMKDAIVSIEDERFYNHQGVDFQGIARALYVDYKAWRSGGDPAAQGASTITQQYVRNAYEQVGSEQTMSRKLTEMMLAAQLEMELSKDDILNSYLNTIYFGNGCYGVEAASKHYFGHSADSVDYYEAAILAAIINAPSVYDPETEEGRAATEERVHLVIDKMYSLGKLGDISQEDLRSLKATPIESKLNITQEERTINQPFYYDYVMNELNDEYSTEQIESGGWQIYTTLSIADGEAARNVIQSIEERYDNGITGAIVDIDNDSGAIHAFCGGLDYNASQYNIATQGHLQTGSTLKPIVYAGLCEYKGYYMSDQMDCTPIDIGTPDKPHLITPYLSGSSATLKQGLIASDNAMAIHAAQTLGMDNVKKIADACGITTPLEDNVVTVIGGQTEGLTPLEMASSYSTIARKGKMIPRWCITSITDGLGNQVYKHEEEENYAFSSEVAAQVTDAMCAAVDEAGWYNIPFDKKGWTIAAKTGTTNDDMDSWCCGFDHQRSVAIWVGGRDERMTVANSSYNTTTAFSSYFEQVGQTDVKKGFDAPQYKTMVPKMEKGQSLESYMEDAQAKQLSIDIQYVTAKETEDGTVLGVQNEGELVRRGGACVVQVARDMVEVPNFSGMTPEDAYNKGKGLELAYTINYSTTGTSTPTVSNQSVRAGEVVAKGTEVTLEITIVISNATKPEIQQVPINNDETVLNMLKKERDELQKQNDQLVSQVDALTTAQEKQAAEEKTETLSEGFSAPNIVGLTASQARQVLQSVGLKVSYTGTNTDIILAMTPSAGTMVKEGDLITMKSASSSSGSSNTNTNPNSNSGSSQPGTRNTNTSNYNTSHSD